MGGKPETLESTFASTHSIQVNIDENFRLLAKLHAMSEREAKIARNNSVCTIITTNIDATKTQEVPIPPTIMPKPNESTTSDAKFDFDLDSCNMSEVIMFLQKLPRSPN